MGSRFHVSLLVISIPILLVAAQKNQDFVALNSLKDAWDNTQPNWIGSDPCGSGWEGVRCTNFRVTAITLTSIGLTGMLSGDIESLSELQTLKNLTISFYLRDLSYNKGLTGPIPASIGNLKKLTNLILIGSGFSGPIPRTIGSLEQLVMLSLNSNSFSGPIPAQLGNLSNLYWLDLADNKLSGAIPVSDATTPGLDMLTNAKHLLFENNNLSGSIPSTLGLVQTLEVLRLDRNSLTGPVPSNLNNLVNVTQLFLSNNQLTGSLPNLTGMSVLNYMDMSNNMFDESDFPPWFSALQSLTTLVMENTGLQGQIPVSFFTLPQLQTLVLRNNQLNGTLDVGSSYSGQLTLIDLQNNSIVGFTQRSGFKIKQLILAGNPFCQEIEGTSPYCGLQEINSTYPTPENHCIPATCNAHQLSSPNCRCAHAYVGTLYFRALSFSDLGNPTIYTSLADSLMKFFNSDLLPVDSVSLSNPTINTDNYFVLRLEVFPPVGQDAFNRTGIGFVLSSQTFKPPHEFGPFFFNGDPYFEGSTGTHKSSSTAIIIGSAVGGSVLVLLALLAGIYAFRQKRRAETADKQNNPFASWDPNKNSGDVPQLRGARSFSFEELKKYTNNFSETNDIGTGGYGKVYRGILPNGQLVAVKQAQTGSLQGGHEFKTEIELLSRVHHKNVVSLVGFCFEQGEQMLVYEYIPNGTLKESLSGKSGIKLDWMRRLRIALGTAKGLQYLHELANPPIIHRDIKSNNILLDDRLNAKVADFGLSKLLGDPERGHVTTQVKGTMGYMDPEYYMTQQLTEKSDVYSYGVVMLELVTARQPIDKGKYIVREVRQKMDRTKVGYNLQEIIDPAILGITLGGLEKFVDLALRCVEEVGAERPTMGEVVKEIESIMQIAGLNPNADSASTSASYEGANKGYNHPYTDESLFVYSGAFLPAKVEPQ
ncbi:hypothetical protein RHGRI_015042 [Rhododendron griersonianum]|uniref:non-specific serine/threonine protein kinase n=1 Tax=Rhododendron griersonianum TaxID=479676 RepID=A0AAV6KBT3_9ERIC|nr:hypothetical protein RHGRI_015042 [Rhododendron griersonianum]